MRPSGSGRVCARGTDSAVESHARPDLFVPAGNNMPELSTLSDAPAAAAPSSYPGSAARGAARPLRHVLDFEKPLAKLEQQIHELESLQTQKQIDYTKELRHLRTNYTSLLRK